jgi:glycosyltransferase involved in cell wall biosynthesis
MLNDIVVSVSMITYKHEAYIAQAINGVLMQQTNFEYELIVADDSSPDETERVVLEIINSHPKGHLIRYFRHKENLGMHSNGIFATQQCRGKYIAICEGDDYWTDPLKLQVQFDFLENNTNYSACFHDCDTYHFEIDAYDVCSSKAKLFKKEDFGIDDLIEDVIINTCTLMFRAESLIIPTKLSPYAIDRVIFMLLALEGEIRFLNRNMAVYRKHIGGVTSKVISLSEIIAIEKRWDFFNEFTKGLYHKSINLQKRKLRYHYQLLKKKDFLFSLFIRIKYYDVFLYYIKRRKWF